MTTKLTDAVNMVVKYTGDNYERWAEDITDVFNLKGWGFILDPTIATSKSDEEKETSKNEAWFILRKTMTEEASRCLSQFKKYDVTAAWDGLKNNGLPTASGERIMLRKLYSIKANEGESFNSFAARLFSIKEKLKVEYNLTVDERLVKGLLIDGALAYPELQGTIDYIEGSDHKKSIGDRMSLNDVHDYLNSKSATIKARSKEEQEEINFIRNKNESGKQRFCYAWSQKGQCSKGNQCPFDHLNESDVY